MFRPTFAALCLALPCALATPLLAADFTLKVSSPTNNDAILRWMQGFETRLEAATDGAIDVQLFPANQLGQIPATIEGAAMGTIEVTAPASSFFVQYDRRFEVLDVPGLFQNLAHAQATLADPEVLDRLATYAQDQGLETIAAFPHGPLGIVSVRAVDSATALQGQRIRVAGPTVLATGPLSALGASPISLPLGEVLPAMQNGVVDGLIAGLPVFTTGRYYDVAQDLTVVPESYLIVTAVASSAFLDTIGEDLADAVRTAARGALEDTNSWNLGAVDAVQGIWEENGGRLVTLPEADAQAYLDAVAAVLPEAEAQNPALADELSFLRGVAQRHAAE
ncbi:TRAP transporter substrate-binding protein [Pararhodobacter sp.]|uniref:TRAP transporter substrate-binding protein n=1 Tax=Pararhodobacter sp. TaxID=2127056 RepID=UPI002AFF57B4|nr:TRAP transporter substrate-binding protein [Pararhodobacter sp.]